MSENTQFLKYWLLTPARAVKNFFLAFKEINTHPRPNTLLYSAFGVFVIGLVTMNKYVIIAGAAFILLAHAHKTWVVGDFRVKPPL